MLYNVFVSGCFVHFGLILFFQRIVYFLPSMKQKSVRRLRINVICEYDTKFVSTHCLNIEKAKHFIYIEVNQSRGAELPLI